MALFNKLFFSSSNKRKHVTNTNSANLWKFPIDSRQIRILLYRECDRRGRRLLFDSDAIESIALVNDLSNDKCNEQIPIGQIADEYNNVKERMNKKFEKKKFSNQNSDFIEINNGYGYRHSKSNSLEISNIGEMIFGALAMSFRGTSLKVHWLESPQRILCSQVFLSPIPNKGANNSTIITNRNLINPRQSITSDTSSIDGYSIYSLSLLNQRNKFTNCPVQSTFTSQTESFDSNSITNPLDLPEFSKIESDSSGYKSDMWHVTGNYQYSARSSIGSILSHTDSLRKLSFDSNASFDPNDIISKANSQKSSDSSIKRRLDRNFLTSFENHNSCSDFIGFIGDNYQTSTNGGSDGCVSLRYARRQSDPNETRSNPELCYKGIKSHNSSLLNVVSTARTSGKRTKLGLAVCIKIADSWEKEIEQFFGEHIALLELMLCRLRSSVEAAYLNHNNFMQIMLNACHVATQWILDLFTAPRLPCPVWLSLNSSDDSKNTKRLAENFIKEFCWLLKTADTKDTNFFISTTITAVLTHHLGWVSTISYKKNSENQAQQKKIEEILIQYPYNPLWAQIGDLFGAIGNPTKIARTIICGQQSQIIEKFLHVITYFIRCGEVKRNHKTEVFNKNEIINALKKNDSFPENSAIKNNNSTASTLTKAKTCHTNLDKISESERTNSDSTIKFTLTTPEDIEVPVHSSNDLLITANKDVLEAIEIDVLQPQAKQSQNQTMRNNFFCNLKSNWSDIQMGLKFECFEQPSEENVEFEKQININNGCEITNCMTEQNTSNQIDYETINSNEISETNESHEYIENNKIDSDQNDKTQCLSTNGEKTNHNQSNVIFVLGDNDKLVNLKKSNEDISEQINCQHHHHHKKHSGVKFNFEEYPKIATNYMKNKNINLYEFDNYGSLAEKIKIHNDPNTSYLFSTENIISNKTVTGTNTIYSSSIDTCEYCMAKTIKSYQTPSNATELEFETTTDKLNFDNTLRRNSGHLPGIEETDTDNKQTNQVTGALNISQRGINLKKVFQNSKNQQHQKELNKNIFNFVKLPLSNSSDQITENKSSGLIPSLFIGITDHYIPDMVLQGTTKEPKLWEPRLQDDLTISSHCASIISLPTENIAIIANMENWEVKIMSSQSSIQPYGTTASGPVGMSQLVAQMLETLYTLSNTGLSAYECLSFLELKLQELYLQSEALAALLLTTEFCSLSKVVNSLNLTENDIPLLLSVASIHSPQVTKRYGISFR